MDNKVLNLTYASSLTDICAVNASFDAGILRIAYPGTNRRKTAISKETFERCLKTIYNCPIVCSYDRETDSIGGHDMEIVRRKAGEIVLANKTAPVGCIPESSRVFWDEVEEDDGTMREYLCAEALIWKRQEAYRKIKQDGIVAQSMEIAIKDGEMIDGVYHIYDFEFTAFALIGVEPCFESSSLELFSKKDFKEQLSEMMHELKASFSLVSASDNEDDNIHSENNSTEGGGQILSKNELVAKYGMSVDSLDFSVDDYSIEELEEKLKTMQSPTDSGTAEDKFSLMSNVIEEVMRTLETVKIQKEWGECDRYWFVDIDTETHEVFCWDTDDWLLYGFTYEMNGDAVAIDFTSKKRKKFVITDFDEGEQPSPFAEVFSALEKQIHDNDGLQGKYQEAVDTIADMNDELGRLREFKADAEASAAKERLYEVFAQFEELAGIEAFENLKNSCDDYDAETLEEKCYAIKGRCANTAKFSLDAKQPKLKVERETNDDMPYGGIFEKYGFSVEN